MNVAGRVSVFVFDKTGTITEENLSVMGTNSVKMSSNGSFSFSEFENDTQ